MKKQISRYLLELRIVLDGLDEEPLKALAERIRGKPRLFVAGLGRSGAVMRAFAERLNQCGLAAHVVLEPGAPGFQKGDLLLVGSGSGTTETMVAVAREAQKRDVAVAVITNNLLSPLGQLADHRVLVPPLLPPERPGEDEVQAPMQACFEQALFLILDALAWQILQDEGALS